MNQANQITSPGNLNWEIWRTQTSYQSIIVDQKVMSWQERLGKLWWTTSRQRMPVSGEKKAEQISREKQKFWENLRNEKNGKTWLRAPGKKQIINAFQLSNSSNVKPWLSKLERLSMAGNEIPINNEMGLISAWMFMLSGVYTLNLISKVLGVGAFGRRLGRGGGDL